MDRELRLRIVIEKPPAGVGYALQEGSGSTYTLVQFKQSDGGDLTFEFVPAIKNESLGGPFVQGPKSERFVYIGIGAYAGEANAAFGRRLKVPLTGIAPKTIAQGGILEARVPGTARDGTPTCATVKDFTGWKPVKR